MGGWRPPAWPSADEHLVAAVRRGEDGAFDHVYDRHAGELHAFCRRILGSRDEADDALQQTFLKAYGALRRSREPIALRPWLFAIARNECLTALRRGEAPEPAVVTGVSEGLAAQVEAREELRATLGDIARLPGEQRQALLLSSVQTRPGHEVAELIGTDRERVKALVFRARRSLASSREARDADCAGIREQLSALRGGSLRRRVIRQHLLECAGCREFRAEVRRERGLVGALLPFPLPLLLNGGGAAAGTGTVALGAKVVAGVAGLAALATGPALVGGDLPKPTPDPRAPEAAAKRAPAPGGEAFASAARPAPAAGGSLRSADSGREGRRPGGGEPGPGGGTPGEGQGGSKPSGPSGPATGAPGGPPAGAAGAAPQNQAPAGPAPGQGETSQPGHGGTLPGQAITPPGDGGAPPAQGGIPPGLDVPPPGHGGTPPGQLDAPAAVHPPG